MLDPVSPEINFQNLEVVSTLLNSHSVNYCVFFGTALGLYRDKGIIKHDDDIDFLVDSIYFDKVIKLMSENHFHPHFLNNLVFVQFRKKIKETVSYVDFYFYEEKKDYLLEKWNFKPELHNPDTYLHIPKSLVYPFVKYNFPTFSTNVPKDLLGTCKYLYGERFKETLIKDKDYRSYVKNNKPYVEYF